MSAAFHIVLVLIFSLQDFIFASPGFHPILAAQVASNLLAEQLPRLSIPNIEQKLPGDQGKISLSRIRISRFKRAQIHRITTSAPDRVSWMMKNLNIGLIGDLSGNVNIVVPFELTGEAEVLAEGLTFQLDSAVHTNANGSAHVSTISCHTTIKSVEVINHNGGLFGLAVQVFKQGISDNVRTLLQGLICKKVKKYFDEDLNRKLSEVQTKSSLYDAVETNALRSLSGGGIGKSNNPLSLEKFFGENFTKDFVIDYTLREPPVCGNDTVDLASVGEISYRGQGATPFSPPPLTWPSISPDDQSMLMILVSDFVPNSLFYHAYQQRLIKLHLDKNTPGVSSFLKTNCSSEGLCISDVLPQLGDKFPNSTLELVFSATRAPAMLFSQKQEGVISINIGGVIIVYVERNGGKHQAAVFDLEVVADTSLNVQRNNISGSVKLTRFELLNRYGNLEITNSELSDIALLGGQLIENMVNEVLSKGVPIPIPSVLHLDRMDVSVHSRKLFIRTDFQVDERQLSKLATKTLFGDLPLLNSRVIRLAKRRTRSRSVK